MIRSALPLLLAAAVVSASLGQSAKPPETKPGEEFGIAGFRVPPGFFQVNDGKKPTAQEFLETSGVTFPEGSEVRLDEAASMLFVRNTKDNLTLVEYLFRGMDCYHETQILVDLQAFECRLPSSEIDSPPPDVARLKALPKHDIVLLDRVTLSTRSGVSATLQNTKSLSSGISGQAAKDTASKLPLAFAANELGTKALVEPVVGADGFHFEMRIEYRYAAPHRTGMPLSNSPMAENFSPGTAAH